MKLFNKIALGTALSLAAPAMAQDVVNYATDGGTILDVKQEYLIGPAEEKLGVDVVVDAMTSRFAPFKAQVLSGKPTWNLIDFSAGYGIRSQNEDLLEKLDYSLIPNAAGVPDAYKDDYTVGSTAYATGLGYSTEAFPDNPPQTWADFWDVEAFPGRRAMRNGPRPALELALLADGVAPEDLYPLDVDRAYDKMAEIKPHIDVWWSSGAETTQLLYDQEVDLMQIWDGRAKNAINEGAPAVFVWNNAIVEYAVFAIPKGSSHPEVTMKVINEMLNPEGQAKWASNYATGPLNTNFAEFMDPERLKELPSAPENLAIGIPLNNAWWASEAGEEAERRWLEFMQQ